MNERKDNLNRLKGILTHLSGESFYPITKGRTVLTGENVKEEHFPNPGIKLAAEIFFKNDSNYAGKMLIGWPDGTITKLVVKGESLRDGLIKESCREETCNPGEWNLGAICDSFAHAA